MEEPGLLEKDKGDGAQGAIGFVERWLLEDA
jgi:hypothetical protein